MAFEADVRPARPVRRPSRRSWQVMTAGIAAATAVLAAAPVAAQPSLRGAPDVPVEVPIPGGFRGFPEILRFTPPAPPIPQMPFGRAVPHRASAARTV
jgi:hypothetical protein